MFGIDKKIAALKVQLIEDCRQKIAVLKSEIDEGLATRIKNLAKNMDEVFKRRIEDAMNKLLAPLEDLKKGLARDVDLLKKESKKLASNDLDRSRTLINLENRLKDLENAAKPKKKTSSKANSKGSKLRKKTTKKTLSMLQRFLKSARILYP